ncbi:unnamed protein product [Medioppia subpectinata]|uniref:non-specific serine/threonine protein kinase n=1 Tax=Medioppia subpectinata TaxID=1979941 RepID=A0A7R9KK35_9ACAR|nr:unnamed protein product [Medioppia subpectinata]CAG2103815.1 unnamed protein product [Medioppia subpectinata]
MRRGGFGEVIKARHKLIGKQYAIKTVELDQNRRVKWHREIQIMVGVKYLHDNGILHRDLKPGNILVVNTVDHVRLKICDFGLAAFHNKGPFNDHSPQLGTPMFEAPEVFRGFDNYDFKVDIYALGVVSLFKQPNKLDPEHSAMKVFIRHLSDRYSDERPDTDEALKILTTLKPKNGPLDMAEIKARITQIETKMKKSEDGAFKHKLKEIRRWAKLDMDHFVQYRHHWFSYKSSDLIVRLPLLHLTGFNMGAYVNPMAIL